MTSQGSRTRLVPLATAETGCVCTQSQSAGVGGLVEGRGKYHWQELPQV